VIGNDVQIEFVEAPLTLRRVTVARFVGDRIAELRQFWYEGEFLEGLALLAVE
jgi:hypothetical protein